MDEKQFLKQIREMKKDAGKYLEKECLRLFRSGGIDPASYQDAPAALLKVIMRVALNNLRDQYGYPGSRVNKYNKDERNLMHF